MSSGSQVGALLEVVVSGVRAAARDIKLFELTAARGGPLPAAGPGAHIELHLPNGMVRQYSLLNCGAAPEVYVVGVKREAEGRGGSLALHDDLEVGARLHIAGPRNHFALDETAPHTVLIAGGIGVTPIWCMAKRLAELERPWSLHYACRSRADAILLDEMGRHSERVRLHLSDRPGARLDLATVVAKAPAGSHVYCCGPLRMLKAFELATAGLADDQVHVEYFTTDADQALDGGFTVELARSGLTLAVTPGQSILDAVLAAGVPIVHSCTRGYCGTCETRVLEGRPDHRDVYLTKAEKASNQAIMLCCSGSLSPRLVLDL